MFIIHDFEIPEDFQRELKRVDEEDLTVFLCDTTLRIRENDLLYGNYWTSEEFDIWLSKLTRKQSINFCHYLLYLLYNLSNDDA